MPLSETVGSRPLWISVAAEQLVRRAARQRPRAGQPPLPPARVFAYTISGKWGYLEHDWVATAGDFVYETPGEATRSSPTSHDEPMKVLFNVKGPLIWLDENGEPDGHFDVHDYIELCKEHYEQNGLGADAIDALLR